VKNILRKFVTKIIKIKTIQQPNEKDGIIYNKYHIIYKKPFKSLKLQFEEVSKN